MNEFSIRPAARWLAALLVLWGLAGCATGPQLIRTQVTTFNQWSALPTEFSYFFSRTLEFQHSLELTTYDDMYCD